MNIERLKRLPSYRELQARKAAEALARRNRLGLDLPEHVSRFNATEEPVAQKPAEEPTEVTREALHNLLLQVYYSKGNGVATQILARFDALSIAFLREADYPAVFAALTAELND